MTNPPIRQSIMQSQSMASQPDGTEISLVVRGAGHFNTHALEAHVAVNLHGEFECRHGYTLHVMGSRSSFVASVLNDACEFLTGSASLIDPTSATPLRIVSTQAGDSAAGSGTQQVEIVYISADSGYSYQMLSHVSTMNGATPVDLPFRAHAIQWMEAIAGGTSEVSLGTITIQNSAGTITYEQITAGGNKSLSGRFMVPGSHTAYLRDWDVGAIQQTMDARLRATCTTLDRTLIDRYLFQAQMRLAGDTSRSEELPGLKVPARGRVKVSAIPGSTAAGNRLDGSFTIMVLADF